MKWVNKIIAWNKNRKEQKQIQYRESLFAFLKTPMTPQQVWSHNIKLIADTAGWMGGNSSEYDLKRMALNNSLHMLSPDEATDFYERLKSDPHTCQPLLFSPDRNVSVYVENHERLQICN